MQANRINVKPFQGLRSMDTFPSATCSKSPSRAQGAANVCLAVAGNEKNLFRAAFFLLVPWDPGMDPSLLLPGLDLNPWNPRYPFFLFFFFFVTEISAASSTWQQLEPLQGRARPLLPTQQRGGGRNCTGWTFLGWRLNLEPWIPEPGKQSSPRKTLAGKYSVPMRQNTTNLVLLKFYYAVPRNFSSVAKAGEQTVPYSCLSFIYCIDGKCVFQEINPNQSPISTYGKVTATIRSSQALPGKYDQDRKNVQCIFGISELFFFFSTPMKLK